MAKRVLFLGENWFGCAARAAAYALRRLGCEVSDIDIQTYLPMLRSTPLRIARRIAEPLILREYNAAILERAAQAQPDFLLASKACQVFPSTLEELRRRGIRLYNYYTDNSVLAYGSLLPKTLPLYDCVFYTKPGWESNQIDKLKLRASAHVAHGYDPEIHFPMPLDERDRAAFGHDVLYIGTYSSYKESVLSQLLERRRHLDIGIWGGSWLEKAKDQRLRRFIRGSPIEGPAYSRALQTAKITLAIMFGPVKGSSIGDRTTTRSYEIPACGGFMLHERNAEISELYREDQEVVLFSSPEELADKIDFYLGNPELRRAIAARGHRRCVPAYSYDARMREILEYDAAACGQRLDAKDLAVGAAGR